MCGWCVDRSRGKGNSREEKSKNLAFKLKFKKNNNKKTKFWIYSYIFLSFEGHNERKFVLLLCYLISDKNARRTFRHILWKFLYA